MSDEKKPQESEGMEKRAVVTTEAEKKAHEQIKKDAEKKPQPEKK